MKKHKYKIVVLSDLKAATSTTLKTTISLAKMIGGDIDFFHVKKPTEIVSMDNQLSAMRNINEKHLATEKKIKKIIDPIIKEYGININYKFTFGNVKDEIGQYINENKPDIIVLGKRKPKMIKFLGDSISHFVLENFDGAVMMAADTNALEPNMQWSLGVLNGVEQNFNIDFAEDLMSHSQNPLKSFKIIKNLNIPKYTPSASTQNLIEYIFEQGDGAIEKLSKYLAISNVNLLFADRSDNTTNSNKNLMDADIQSIMDQLNVSLLVSNVKLR